MNEFSLLIKPSAADCNLRCAYCFYIGRLALAPARPRMSDAVLERTIASYLGSRQATSYTFSWQGGEPGLLGLSFFKKVVKLQLTHAPAQAVICNAFQTNGTLISEKMADFAAEYKFLFGVSLDGPAQLHDYYRKTVGGEATHADVIAGIERLQRHGVEFNILTLVTNRSVKQPRELYGYFKNQGYSHQQYIPCVEFDSSGKPRPYAIDGRQWGAFLCALFDRWSADDVGRVSIRIFDAILEQLIHGKASLCTMGKDCRQYFVVEYDGAVYPCDFFVGDGTRLGNIMDGEWEDFLASQLYREFGMGKAHWCAECAECPHLPFCHGDCQKFRSGNGRAKSVLCEGWRMFYDHALPRLRHIAREMQDHVTVSQNPEGTP